MIGVKLDQARHDQVAIGVFASRRRVAFAEFGNASIRKGDPAALDHAIRQHDPGVANNGFGFGRSHLKHLPSCRNFHAAAANDVTSTIRSAIKWRIPSSWTMATMATPWRFF